MSMNMVEPSPHKNVAKRKLSRCLDWIAEQNNMGPKNKNVNDVQFIMQVNADRKKFLISAAEDEATVPDGVDENVPEPKEVPRHKLRQESLHMQCGWQHCTWFTDKYEDYQRHVQHHSTNVGAVETQGKVTYSCHWDICGHETDDFDQMVRHINFHAYHAKLLAVGYNGRATLKLAACKRDSTKRNILPPLLSDFECRWIGCSEKFRSFQVFLDHVKQHSIYADKNICSWAGCGMSFPRRVLLTTHVRSHTGEKLIACYHCGAHFCNNRRLADHLRRQVSSSNSGHICSMCGKSWATEYLLREHSRRHVSVYACTLCDMSAATLSQLASHVAYRHMDKNETRIHQCPHCDHRSVTKWDLRTHIKTHERKKAKKNKAMKRKIHHDSSNDSDTDESIKEDKIKISKKYICHMCQGGKKAKVFVRGSLLTAHLVKVHGVQWPFGHSRFRYQISDDGFYRLTTTRYESLEVSKKIVDSPAALREPIKSSVEFAVAKTAEATETSPAQFTIQIKEDKPIVKTEMPSVEIEVCDVDDKGNIISSKIINSEVVYE